MKVYNTLSRKKVDFKPIDDKKVNMYVCGPTVYNYISVGNSRPIIVFDMVRNYLEYKGYKVFLIQNITDIEDKIINKANKEKVGYQDITDKYTQAFIEDIQRLGVGKIDAMPFATKMIDKIIELIEKIIENGYAYVEDGNVYFDVLSFKDYGKLSGQKTDNMLEQEKDDYVKKNPADFALWKKAKEGEPRWESPWGMGRPGWHIECSAMSRSYSKEGIDIHGGGLDLIFPHHENEIAQSEAAYPKEEFVRYWMHNGMIEVKEEKMSKSKGLRKEWILRNLIERFEADVIKIYVLSTHYRSPLEFSMAKLEEAEKAYSRIINTLVNLKFLIDKKKVLDKEKTDLAARDIMERSEEFERAFIKAMDDDFNSAMALGQLFDFIKDLNSIVQDPGFELSAAKARELKRSYKKIVDLSYIFGLNLEKNVERQKAKDKKEVDSSRVEKLIEKRNEARKAKDFKEADRIRQELLEEGIILEDRKEGTIWRIKS
jgi:cysteinyl-tRNA synthetase